MYKFFLWILFNTFYCVIFYVKISHNDLINVKNVDIGINYQQYII